MRCRRILSALSLAVLAVASLSACQTKVGQAAAVGGDTLSNSALSDYVAPGSTPYVDSQGAQVVPKINALTNWVRNELVRSAIAAKGGAVTPSELDAARGVVTQAGLPPQITRANAGHGYTRKFDDLLVDQTALLVVLIQRIVPRTSAGQAFNALESGRANNALFTAIAGAHAKVDLSPRYGTWQQQGLRVSPEPGAGAPDFVSFG